MQLAHSPSSGATPVTFLSMLSYTFLTVPLLLGSRSALAWPWPQYSSVTTGAGSTGVSTGAGSTGAGSGTASSSYPGSTSSSTGSTGGSGGSGGATDARITYYNTMGG